MFRRKKGCIQRRGKRLDHYLIQKENKKVSLQLGLGETGHVYREETSSVYREDATIQENTLLFRGFVASLR